MSKISDATTVGDTATSDKYAQLLVSENIIDPTIYQQKSENLSDEEVRSQKKELFMRDIEKRFVDSVASQIQENEDPFIQKIIYQAAKDQTSQFAGIYDNIITTTQTQ